MRYTAVLCLLVASCGSDSKSSSTASADATPTPTPSPTYSPLAVFCSTKPANASNGGQAELKLLRTIKVGNRLTDIVPEARELLLKGVVYRPDATKVTSTGCKTYDVYGYFYESGTVQGWDVYVDFCNDWVIQTVYCPADNSGPQVSTYP